MELCSSPLEATFRMFSSLETKFFSGTWRCVAV